ncbi:MAG: KH domain-containing protein [Thermoleophilaceae bacterium]|nr:KH domain-containing protein [Thermoleophilaceae bacterium]
MEELLRYLARSLVAEREEVEVDSVTEEDGTIVLELRVAKDEVGRVIGRGGRTINALRAVIRAAAVKHEKRVLVDVID